MLSLARLTHRPGKLPFLAACIPPIVLLLCILRYNVDVLFWDEWTIWGDLLAAMKTQPLTFWQLIAQQNEQRNFAARAIGLLLMPSFRLDRYAEFLVMFGMNVLCYFCVLFLSRLTHERLGARPNPWLPAWLSLFCFSTVQWQAYAYGANTSIFLTVLCLLLGLILLETVRPGWPRLVGLVVVGLMGSFNFANGLFYWICLFPLLFLSTAPGTRRALDTAFFAMAGVAAWVVYFTNYIHPDLSPPLLLSVSALPDLLAFFGTYVGTSLFSDENLFLPALVLGLSACGLICWTIRRLLRAKPEAMRTLSPWFSLLAFFVLTDAVTAVGRAGFGVRHAMQSRYVPFTNLFWFAYLVLFSLALTHVFQAKSGLARVARAFVPLILAAVILSDVLGVVVFHNRHKLLVEARNSLFSLVDDTPLLNIFQDPEYVRKVVPILFQERLSVYRDIRRMDQYRPAKASHGPAGSVEAVTVVDPGGKLPSGLRITGRAMDPASGTPARYVCFACGQTLVFAAKPDAQGRFDVLIPSDYFPMETVHLRPLAVLSDGVSVQELAMPVAGEITLPKAWYPSRPEHGI